MSPNQHVHRELKRGDHGEDVRELQKSIRARATKLKLPWLVVDVTGHVDPRTENAANLILFALGDYGPNLRRIRGHHEISEYAQRLLRGTRRRNPAKVALAVKRKPEVRRWRKAHEDRTPVTVKSAIKGLFVLIGKGMAYVFGGGHMTPADGGPGDCSWLASWLWQHFEPALPTGTTFTLAEAGVEGFGRIFSLMIKNIAGEPDESHVIERWEFTIAEAAELKIEQHRCDDGFFYTECGGSDNPTAGNGPTFFTPGLGMGLTLEARLAEFSIHRHPEGF
jgi:hypothetical protein